jgi:hypothetical protein
VAWYLHWSDFLLTASLDHWAVLAVVCRDHLVVQTTVLNAFWILGILPNAASLANLTFFVRALAAVLSGDTGSAVEGGTVRAVAAILGLDAVAGGAHGVADMGAAERSWVAVLLGVLEEWVAALLDCWSLMWTVLADLWILVNAIWTVLLTVTVDLLVQRAECHAG